MILIELVWAIAIVCLAIAFFFKLPFFAFLTTVPIWMFVTAGFGTGAIYGATSSNTAPIERGGGGKRPETLFEAFIRIFVNTFIFAIAMLFIGGLTLVFGLILPLISHDPILVRIISVFLSLCLGYMAGTAMFNETK